MNITRPGRAAPTTVVGTSQPFAVLRITSVFMWQLLERAAKIKWVANQTEILVSALLISLITFLLVLGGSLLGMYFRNALSDDHLRDDVRDVIRLSTGLIGTIAALVLGLLIASAKSSYDARSTQIKQITAIVILLDRFLEQYGSDAHNLRIILRNAVAPGDRSDLERR